MASLDNYSTALQVLNPALDREALCLLLESQEPGFADLIIDHGLGPLWHQRTGREEFLASRRLAEALFLIQQEALSEIDSAFEAAGLDYAVMKGSATRLLSYDNPAVRACHDLDLLVRPGDKLRAASALVGIGFAPSPEARSISREIVLSRGPVEVDLHWGILREGRLRVEPTHDMLARRRRCRDSWTLGDDDSLFVMLVHPAFAKHLDAWELGLHRVADIVEWLRRRPIDWPVVRERVAASGVRTASWATLRWVCLTAGDQVRQAMADMLVDLEPGMPRRLWLNNWLGAGLSSRTAGARWFRLLAFSSLLHDTPRDVLGAFAGWRRARSRAADDLRDFQGLLGQ
jgi:hypothetical protein